MLSCFKRFRQWTLPVVEAGQYLGLLSLEALDFPGTTEDGGPDQAWRDLIMTEPPVLINSETLFDNLPPLRSDILAVLGPDTKYRGFITREEAGLWQELSRYRDTEYEFETIFEASHDGLHITDNRGYTLKLNRACEDLMEFTREQVVGRHLSEIVDQGLIPESAALMALESGEIASRLHYGKNGKTVLLTATPIYRDGEIYRIVINNRDITELKALEDKLSQAEKRARKYRRELESLRDRQDSPGELIYQSDAMRRLAGFARHVAQVDSTILIQGESGVGKELFSRLIHRNSLRKSRPFVKIDCGAIPENLLESELFGYEKGAFTGARKEGKVGLIETAQGGTLFLDEIGEMPLMLQAKLLRVLQDREIQRIGGGGTIRVDVRVLAATNKDLEAMVAERRFREDLYYRLNVVPLKIPPLRERPADVEPLIYHLMDEFAKKYGLRKRLSPEAMEILNQYSWPGNVRELKNIVERIVVTSIHELIQPEDLPGALKKRRTLAVGPLEGGPLDLPYRESMELFEKQFLEAVKSRCGSTREMADRLGIDRSTVRRRMNRVGIPFHFD